jgi:MFS family permease
LTDGSPGRWRPWPLAEPAVALTDWALAAECACCVAALLSRRGDDRVRRAAGFAFFGATGVAAALGGVVHGYFPDPRHPWQPRLWGATLLALGASGAAAWTIAARVALSPRRSRGVLALGALGYTAYGGIILSGRQQFAVAVAGYLPANLFLLGAFAARYRRRRERAAAQALGGIALTLVASGIQQGRLTLHPRYADHNTLYHLVMGVALALFCAGLRGVAGAPRR